MKKILSLVVTFCIAVTAFAGCGDVVENIDSDKTQIWVSVYDGGYGTSWLNYVKADFEADYPDYQVIIRGTHDEDLSPGNNNLNYDVYFTTTNLAYHSLVAKDIFADLSSIYETTLENETASVKDKVNDYQLIKEALSYPGKNGVYAVPFTSSFTGFVYDHDLFKEHINDGWLFKAPVSEKTNVEADGITCREEGDKLIFISSSDTDCHYVEGDVILRAGKDKVYGTYDDGQPETLTEWNNVMALIRLDTTGAKPITFSDSYAYEYTRHIVEAVFAQYEGVENYNIFNTFDGTYKHNTGDAGMIITPQTGYKVYQMEGVNKALQFYYDNVCNSDMTTVADDSSHTDAQNKFLLWDFRTAKEPGAAMLIEGVWWEYEAKATFDSLGGDYAYGTRDYRYMLYPDIEGQNGIDGNGHGSVFAVQDVGLTLVANNNDSNFVDVCKKFVEYSLKDDALRHFTVTTGAVRPFKYTLLPENLAQMTRFQKTVFEITQDKQNIQIVSPVLQIYRTPLGFGTELSSNRFSAKINSAAGSVVYTAPSALRNKQRIQSLEQWITGMNDYYTSSWSEFYQKVKIYYED